MPQILTNPLLTGVVLVVVSILTLLFNLGSVRAYEQQTFVAVDSLIPGQSARRMPPRAQLFLPFISTLLMAAVAFALDSETLSTVGGGFLLLELVGLAQGVGNFFGMRSLSRPFIAEGHLSYSAEYRYRAFAGQMFGSTCLSLGLALVTQQPMFVAGSFFLFSAALGSLRRSQQARRAA